ncbi:single-stranded DNA-binding protein [Haemophilus sp. HMSC073C03]|uniref:ERF family protein n=1 Tax=Haemophilus sp. HMSC073C03 TaxID=1739452 RepID=UPI0008A28E0E|nr:ERF family protein [Haemophilus sp. HMSC073C03]OFQ18015.1 single-stranded DNA-binding protein [Haemophilus sp. HMSC073C03]
MSIYAKLAQARVKLQKENLKKTGNNRSFKYFELKDFLPRVNEIFEELKMCAVVRYSSELATLTIYDCEKDESIEFTSPMVQKALPSGTEIQNLGAIQTYQRRYLYLTALEIVEDDLVDSIPPEKAEQKKQESQRRYNESIQQNVNSIQDKSILDKLKAGLKECGNKKELEERYAKQMPWIETNHPDLIDEYNSFYDECINNLKV